jgi:uncharacterized protein YodC (DUF2158 family)
MENFTAGETVWLKTSGPAMTIHDTGPDPLTGDDTALCEWFVNGKHEWARFPLTSLTKTKPLA